MISDDIENINLESKLQDESKLKHFLFELIKKTNNKKSISIDNEINILRKIYKILPSKVQLRYIYEKYYNNIQLDYNLQKFLIKRAMRSRSGVLVSTVVLKPDVFSCPMKCSYCPTETNLEGKPTQPKSINLLLYILKLLKLAYSVRLFETIIIASS